MSSYGVQRLVNARVLPLFDCIQPLDNLDEGEEHGDLGHARGGVDGPGISVLSCRVENPVQCLTVFRSECAPDLLTSLSSTLMASLRVRTVLPMVISISCCCTLKSDPHRVS